MEAIRYAVIEAGNADAAPQQIEAGEPVVRVANPAHLLAHTDYCGPITAIVGARTVVGTRFHPEKAKRRGCS